jgi:hypothetical protein
MLQQDYVTMIRSRQMTIGEQHTDGAASRSAYSTPRLTDYGLLSALTRGQSSKPKPDDKGQAGTMC